MTSRLHGRLALTIWDLDNCLADDAWRVPFIDWTQPDPDKRYAAYHAPCGLDAMFEHNADIFRAWAAAGALPVFCTGRPESVYVPTRDWIEAKLGINVDERGTLLMRPDGNKLPTAELKRTMLTHVRARWPGHLIAHAFDDHDGVLDVYREHAVPAMKLFIHSVDAYNPPQKVQLS